MKMEIIVDLVNMFAQSPQTPQQMPKIFSGVGQLIDQFKIWIMGIIGGSTIAITLWHIWMKQMAEGESAEIAARNKAIKRTIITGLIGEGIVGIYSFIKAFMV